MKIGTAALLGLFLLTLVPTQITAWEWPVPVPVVQRTFATQVDDTVLRGVELGGGAQPVFPVDDGVVVYVHQDGTGYDHPYGSYVVIEHDQAFRSIYAHLSGDALPPVGMEVSTGVQIGVVGDSGFVDQPTLRFYLFDSENAAYVNPMLLLPDLTDRALPVIGTLYASNASGTYNLDQLASVPPGNYELSVEITDAVAARSARGVSAPYSIALFLDGQQRFVMRADGLVVQDGKILFTPHQNGREMYGELGSWNVGRVEIPSGVATVELIVSDFAGNQRVRTVQIEGSTQDEDVQ
jgi:hypothetical protein